MTPEQARASRLTTLTAVVAAGAACATTNLDLDWFQDGEDAATWRLRVQELRAVCAGCPVLAQCREVALRLDADTCRFTDDMVRAGLTTTELNALARERQESLATIEQAPTPERLQAAA